VRERFFPEFDWKWLPLWGAERRRSAVVVESCGHACICARRSSGESACACALQPGVQNPTSEPL